MLRSNALSRADLRFSAYAACGTPSLVYAQDASRSADGNYRVVGGTVAAERAWPSQVAIYVRQPNDMFQLLCGGSIISERWVLTAAHCMFVRRGQELRPLGASDLLVVEGTNQIDPLRSREQGKGRALDVREVVVHESYSHATGENDIALLALAAPSRSLSIQLSTQSDSQFEVAGRAGVVIGWGRLRPVKVVDGNQIVDFHTNRPVRPGDPDYFTDRLMQAELPIVDREVCRTALADLRRPIDERQICAGLKEGGRDSCQGDSGGPLLTRKASGQYIQIGIISWGRSCALPKGYGVNTRVSAFEPWIRSKTSNAPPSQVAIVAPTPPQPQLTVAAIVQNTLSHSNSAGLSVDIVQGDALKIGQSVQFRVLSQRPGYLLLIDVAPDGKVTQIFPNARSLSLDGRQNSNVLRPGEPLLVPHPRDSFAGFEMTVVPPLGGGLLVAVLSEQPLKSISVPASPRTMEGPSAIDFVTALAAELQRDLSVDAGNPRRNWSVAMKPYQVER